MKVAALAVSLLAIGLTVRAQTPAQSVAHARDGGTVTTLQSIDVVPLINAPFTAEVNTEWTTILADGTTATVWNRRTIARDSTGRIFQERRFLAPNGNTVQPALRTLEYADPNRHEFYNCIVAEKTCYLSKYLRPAMPEMPAGIGGLELCNCASPQNAGVTITHEALGQKTVENIEATGSREVTTLPAGRFGNEQAQPVVKEFWYSPRLGLNLITKRFDPRSGVQNFVVANLSLNEPDPNLFQPPAEYQVVRQVVERPGIAQSTK
jgi:hypothetical protein